MCDFHLGTNGWPLDYECINGVAMDIDEYCEGPAMDVIRWLAPCHPKYCKTCRGTGEVDDGDCVACNGTGATDRVNDSIERLEQSMSDDARKVGEE